jgi:hypothetical protein
MLGSLIIPTENIFKSPEVSNTRYIGALPSYQTRCCVQSALRDT